MNLGVINPDGLGISSPQKLKREARTCPETQEPQDMEEESVEATKT